MSQKDLEEIALWFAISIIIVMIIIGWLDMLNIRPWITILNNALETNFNWKYLKR